MAKIGIIFPGQGAQYPGMGEKLYEAYPEIRELYENAEKIFPGITEISFHGTADDFIPYEMMDTLYNAKPGDNKAELTAEGAGHGEAMYALGDSYWDTVFDFIAPYMA